MRLGKGVIAIGMFFLALGLLISFPCEAAAGMGFNRKTWDLLMRFVNFGIFMFFIVKYGKKPLLDYLRGQSEKVAGIFHELEEEREKLEKARMEQDELIAGMDARIEKLKRYYLELGEEEKRKILARAQETKKLILAEAEAAAKREFEKAKEDFRMEVINMAITMAEERLRKKITKRDQKRLIKSYVEDLTSGPPSTLPRHL